MDNVGRILKDRHISVNGLLALIHDRHPDCGLPYSILRRLVSHERKMSIDEAILICDALDIPFTALFDFAGEVPHGPLKGMTSADIYRACDAAGTWHTIGKRPGLGKRSGNAPKKVQVIAYETGDILESFDIRFRPPGMKGLWFAA